MQDQDNDSVSEETIRRRLMEGYKPRGWGDRYWRPSRPRRLEPPRRQPPPVIEAWLGPWEELIWQAFGKQLASQQALDRWVTEWQGTGMSIEQAREWLSRVHPSYPQPAGDLQAAGITAWTAFRPLIVRGQQTYRTVYGMVASNEWTVARAIDVVERARARAKAQAAEESA